MLTEVIRCLAHAAQDECDRAVLVGENGSLNAVSAHEGFPTFLALVP